MLSLRGGIQKAYLERERERESENSSCQKLGWELVEKKILVNRYSIINRRSKVGVLLHSRTTRVHNKAVQISNSQEKLLNMLMRKERTHLR